MSRKIFKIFLSFFTRHILKKYHPEIIGITGSVGKSSTKEAVYTVLTPFFSVRKSEGNYNTEIGVPLTIIGARSGKKSFIRWSAVFLRALALLIFRDKKYPEILVLEMAADAPGDIAHLARLIRPHIGIVTNVGISHLENFGNITRVAKEKGELVAALPKAGRAILNADDARVLAMAERAKAGTVTFGFDQGADIRALEVSLDQKIFDWEPSNHESNFNIGGTWAKIQYQGTTIPLYLPNVFGKTHVYAAIAATAVGIVKGLNLVKIVEALRGYTPPPGRLRMLPGIKATYLIDDTYNAAPDSMKAALEVLRGIELHTGGRRYAVLGDMLELGAESETAHEEIGRRVRALYIDDLIVVGARAAGYITGARAAGMPEENIYHFGSTDEAGKFVQDRLHSGDLALIKASRGMHFERIVQELMAEPEKAGQLLVH